MQGNQASGSAGSGHYWFGSILSDKLNESGINFLGLSEWYEIPVLSIIRKKSTKNQ